MLDSTSLIITSTLISFCMAFICLFCFYGEHKRHLLLWAVSWLLYSITYAFRWGIALRPIGVLLIGNYISTMLASYFMFIGTNTYAEKVVSFWWRYAALLVLLIYFPFGYGKFSYLKEIPAILYVTIMYFSLSVTLFRNKNIEKLERTILAVCFLLWSINLLSAGIIRAYYRPDTSLAYLLLGVIGLITGVSLLLSHYRRNIKRLIEISQQLHTLSITDSLTGIYNRGYIEDALVQLNNENKIPFSVLMGDLDKLKVTNDTQGHFHGDKLLIAAAEILKKCCRDTDLVARWGGDEFLIVMPNTDLNIALKTMVAIKEACQRFTPGPIHMSIGVASKETKDKSLVDIINEAEQMMYDNKKNRASSL